MSTKAQLEIIRHTSMNPLEIFLIEMTSKQPHGHSDLEMGIIMQGSMTLYVEQEKYDLKKGDIYLINRFQLHSFANPTGQNFILAFQIHPDFYRKIHHQLGYLHFQENVIREGQLYDELYKLLTDCADCHFKLSVFNEVKCASLFLNAFHLLLRNVPYILTSEREYSAVQNNTLRINRITDYIMEHYQERITLEDIASMENITTYHASHFIKKMLQISFQEYLNNVRFDHALQLIHQTNLSTLDICLESGFSSSHYLNQMFLKTFGCTTREYLARKSNPAHIEAAPPETAIQKRYSHEHAAILFEKLK